METQLATYDILIGRERTTLRTTRDGLYDHLRGSRPDAAIVKRGLATWRIYSGGRGIGSIQELGL